MRLHTFTVVDVFSITLIRPYEKLFNNIIEDQEVLNFDNDWYLDTLTEKCVQVREHVQYNTIIAACS